MMKNNGSCNMEDNWGWLSCIRIGQPDAWAWEEGVHGWLTLVWLASNRQKEFMFPIELAVNRIKRVLIVTKAKGVPDFVVNKAFRRNRTWQSLSRSQSYDSVRSGRKIARNQQKQGDWIDQSVRGKTQRLYEAIGGLPHGPRLAGYWRGREPALDHNYKLLPQKDSLMLLRRCWKEFEMLSRAWKRGGGASAVVFLAFWMPIIGVNQDPTSSRSSSLAKSILSMIQISCSFLCTRSRGHGRLVTSSPWLWRKTFTRSSGYEKRSVARVFLWHDYFRAKRSPVDDKWVINPMDIPRNSLGRPLVAIFTTRRDDWSVFLRSLSLKTV